LQSEADQPAFKGPYLVQAAPKAMVRFALGSSVTIATLLCIPDGVGILPGSESYYQWLVRITGLWCAAYILWAFGFLATLYFVRLVGGGIEIYEDGLKLWRFGKIIPWQTIKAISCEPQPLFSRVFFLPDMVYKLTLYKAKKGLTGKDELGAHHIPSFQLDPEEFRNLLTYVSRRCFSTLPAALSTTLAEPEAQPVLKQSFERGRVMRVVVSVIIAFSLVSFLGRRAAVNYFFNMGNKEFRHERYDRAENNYAQAAAIDQFFAPAWDRLARCEARQGKMQEAEEHWRIALLRKPDFVESKIGLSQIVMNRGQYTEARKLLEGAVRLSPTNIAAFMNLANLDLLMDDAAAAEKLLVPITKRDPYNVRAHGLLARAYLRQLKVQDAQRIISSCDRSRSDTTAADIAFFESMCKQVHRAANGSSNQ
jgi:Tfp pilus assembly protein PilF